MKGFELIKKAMKLENVRNIGISAGSTASRAGAGRAVF